MVAAFTIFGGLALFLLGMQIMTEGLRLAAGDRLRIILSRATRRRGLAITLGTFLGFLIHSSAAGVMTIGFINAGLMPLLKAIPVFFGANIGTTLSMQIISFRLTDLAYVAVAVGFLLQFSISHSGVKHTGQAILGFGLLFLGMHIMSGAIEPYRDVLAPALTRIDGTSIMGMITGIIGAAILTTALQSSGAVIGMTFVMITAGVFTSLDQVYPIVLGAHIGTSTTAIIASIGAHIEARRAALVNLGFNIFNVVLAVVAAPLFLTLIPMTSDDLVHQTANLHTAVMVVAAAILLPFTPALAGLANRYLWPRVPVPERSHLQPEFLIMPERALMATLRELQRAARICRESLRECATLILSPDRKKIQLVHLNEKIVDELKEAVRDYLHSLTHRYLSRRQALLVQYLTHISNDIERIGDHVEHLAHISVAENRAKNSVFDETAHSHLQNLCAKADEVLGMTVDALNPELPDFESTATSLLAAKKEFESFSAKTKSVENDRVARHQISPLTGLFFSEYALTFDRMVRHCRMIAEEQLQPFFAFAKRKVNRVEPPCEDKIHKNPGKTG